jgi:hypothetical protein
VADLHGILHRNAKALLPGFEQIMPLLGHAIRKEQDSPVLLSYYLWR